MDSLKILLVEDDKPTSILLEKFLKKRFKSVEVAFDGREAFSKFKNFSPNIILTDINMPKLDGINFIKEVKKLDIHVRVIMLTAHNEQENLSEAVKLGLDDFLLKPVSLEKLKNALESASKNYKKDYLFLTDKFYWCLECEVLFNEYDEIVALTKNEKKFLTLLCKNKNVYFSKYDISEDIYESIDKLNNVRTLISRLKSKTSSNLIESVFDEGYRINLR